MPNVQSVFFGVSPAKYDDGVQPYCAINASNRFITAHRGASDVERTLRLKAGTVVGASLSFGPTSDSIATGQHPAVALTNGNIVIEAHDDNTKLYYSVRTLAGNNTFTLESSGEITPQDDESSDPTIAVNSGGVVVEVHRSEGDLRWRLGQIAGKALTWQTTTHRLVAGGDVKPENASVTINDAGMVVVAYQKGSKLYAQTGKYNAANATLEWKGADNPDSYDSGVHPSVALTNDRWVYEVHQSETRGRIFQRVGRLAEDASSIDWKAWLGGDQKSYPYDDGTSPYVASNGSVAIQVHVSETIKELFATASLVFDRANWMSDNRRDLADQRLNQLVLPASHNAGFYIEDDLLSNQTLPILGQLSVGVRYFDLRPVKVGNNGPIRIHHDDSTAVPLQVVLDDIREFMKDHNELVILKFSHYGTADDPFNQGDFNELVTMLRDSDKGLRQWLLTNDPEQRIGATKLQRLLAPNSGTVLIFADADQKKNSPQVEYLDRSLPGNKGIRRYRDWYAPDPENGDLTVFDIFSDTDNFDAMATGTGNDPDARATDRAGNRLPRGQFPKFALFDGNCRNKDGNNNVPCDLFLLSWTLTPDAGGAVGLSRDANKKLVDNSSSHPDATANRHGQKINLLYTDVVQESRSTDVALLRLGLRR